MLKFLQNFLQSRGYAAMAQVGLNIAPAAVGNNKVSADSCEVIDLDI